MRSSLMLAAAAVALTSLAAPMIADACGGYDSGPRAPLLYLVSAHHDGDHTFVLLNDHVDPKEHTWTVLQPMSFDRTAIAPAPAFTSPLSLTLLGPDGATQVSTSTQVLIDNAMDAFQKPTRAAQIAKSGGFRVAAWGTHQGLTWKDVRTVERSRKVDAWARHLGVDPNGAHMSREGDVAMLSAFDANAKVYRTHIDQGGTPLGSYVGSPLGVITADGQRFVVLVDAGAVRTAPLLATTAKPRR